MYFVGLVVLLDSWFGVLVLLPFPFLDISALKKLMMNLMQSKWREGYCVCDLELRVRYGLRYDAVVVLVMIMMMTRVDDPERRKRMLYGVVVFVFGGVWFVGTTYYINS